MSAITGSYAFLFSGFDFSNYPEAQPLTEGGIVTANGAGSFESGGVGDVNDNGKVTSNQALSGAYDNSSGFAPPGSCTLGSDGVVDVCGRASATLTFGAGTYNYVYYIVNGGNIKFMDVDAASGASGTYYAVAAGSMFTAASSLANGNYAFTVAGAGKASSSQSGPPLAGGGVFAASGGTITSSSVDVNSNGTLQSGTPGGTYSIGSNGRGSLTFTTAVNGVSKFEAYATASNGLLMLETDANLTSAGTAWPQSATTFGSGNYAGGFTSSVTVTHGTQSGSGEEDAVGQVIAGTTGTFTGENMDVNQLSSSGGGISNQNSGSAVGGTFTTTQSNGRYTGTLTLSTPASTLNEIFYVVGGGANGTPNILFIETDKIGDGTGPGTGVLELQNLTP
jgi:hypothetical protein